MVYGLWFFGIWPFRCFGASGWGLFFLLFSLVSWNLEFIFFFGIFLTLVSPPSGAGGLLFFFWSFLFLLASWFLFFFISILISKISHLLYCFLCASTTGGSPLNGLTMRPMVFAPREAARSTLRSP